MQTSPNSHFCLAELAPRIVGTSNTAILLIHAPVEPEMFHIGENYSTAQI